MADKSELEDIATQLGYAVVVWGMLENTIRELFRDVVLTDDRDKRVQAIILSETPLRAQIGMIKKAAGLRQPGQGDWLKRLTDSLNLVAGRLHEERNRLVHDLWEQQENGEVMKIVRGKQEVAASKKADEWQLVIAEPQPALAGEIETFFHEAADQIDVLSKCWIEFGEWKLGQMKAQRARQL
ncbi:hypothetical protein CA223_19760 [Sphingomonas koreensis]|jgi:hypothetical protein|uniref:Uncharacterized protein n=1 Tax=Sphingomonas koreensis TaxID=93064 RepID=A0A1L6JCN9_9SPHN|nr:hypothetical protein [Sphingomonas koreensis]APR53675.1 hypothetical protein BRX40_15720 [Sphingomonas koreensis]RSU24193.1 hypothetical protein CA224_00120 [Sphingomonas koreensis]RSU25896.1 hypothetical protein CA222_10455 [Sphingomonas koreensis]RSU26051.1 hypothetical protein CA222_11360 [Sphingomonas koreensis]RSU27933.1 hypothetical protein CA225_09740 [Sphingomonas koreensis]